MNKIIIIIFISSFLQCCTSKYKRHEKSTFKIERTTSDKWVITGLIKSKINLEPLSNVYIYLNNSSKYQISDENGFFKIDNLSNELNFLTFKCVGHDSLIIKNLNINAKENLFIRVELGYHMIF
jgi:hypothetical protein